MFYVANSLLASLEIYFLEPLRLASPRIDYVPDVVTEVALSERFEGVAASPAAADWLRTHLAGFAPTLIVFCRYSGPHAPMIVDWAREAGVPTIFHLDDDLLNVPIELGAAKQAFHNRPDRLATVRFLLRETTLVYCSTDALKRRLFADAGSSRVVSGAICCAHGIKAGPTTDRPPVIGYMGSDHRHDFQLALPALTRLLEARPDVVFEMFGSTPIPDDLRRFGDRIRTRQTVSDYASFVETLSTLGWTIGICPLAKTPFNETKANVKWVEYTSAGFATVASRGTVYDACCADGCGLLADSDGEWLAAFEKLLDDHTAHRGQVEKAQARLARDYSPAGLQDQVLAVFAQAHALNHSDLQERNAALSPGEDEPALGDAAGSELLQLDEPTGNQIRGWAWSPREIGRADKMRIEVSSGELVIGTCARLVARPDVDAHVGDPVGAKGFALPVGCLAVLWLLLRDRGDVHPGIRYGDLSCSLVEGHPLLQDIAAFQTLRSLDPAQQTEQGWCLVDLWWSNSRLLKLRTGARQEGTPEARATRLRAFQPMPDQSGRLSLVLVDEVQLSMTASIVPVDMRHPLMPILLVGYDERNDIVFTDLVPFPSLLRGGLHESETAAIGPEGGTSADIRNLSDAYVAEAVGWRGDAPAHTVREIGVDLAAATGAETIFDPAVGSWLASVFGIALTGSRSERPALGDDGFVAHAQGLLARARPQPPRPGRAILALPCRAIPTVGALVSRRLRLPSRRKPGAFIVVDDAYPSRRWVVSFPDATAFDLYAKLEAGLREFPALDVGPDYPAADGADDTLDHAHPIAILHRDLEPQADTARVFAVPQDKRAIVPAAPQATVPQVSVIASPTRYDIDAIGTLIDAVAGQVTATACELILPTQNLPPSRIAEMQAKLDAALPGRGTVIAVEPTLNASRVRNTAAASARGNVYVFLSPAAVLHDHRTLETLGRLACLLGIGTVGCMMVTSRTPGDGVAAFRSAGSFPGRIDFTRAPNMGLVEIDCREILPNAIYPVAANAPECFAISSAAWNAVAGLDDRRLPNVQAEIDLAARLVQAGCVNICTTLLSVFVEADEAERRRSTHDVQAAANLDVWRYLPALRASTILRSF